MRKVVVTGYGIISPSGNDAETLWKNISTGTSGIKKIEDPAFAESASRVGGVIGDFLAEAYLEAKEAKKYDRYIQYAYAAAKQALDMANPGDDWDAERAGVYVGSGVGGIETIMRNHEAFLAKGARRVSPFLVPMMISNMASGVIAIKTGFKGANYAPVSACATANTAIGEAFLSIRHGYADMMLAGGADAGIHPFLFAGFSSMKALTTNNDHPTQASRPFDSTATDSSCPKGPPCSCLKTLSTPRGAGPPFWAKWRATALPATRGTSPRRIFTARPGQ